MDLSGAPIMFTMKLITKPLRGHKEVPQQTTACWCLEKTEDNGGEGLSSNVYMK